MFRSKESSPRVENQIARQRYRSLQIRDIKELVHVYQKRICPYNYSSTLSILAVGKMEYPKVPSSSKLPTEQERTVKGGPSIEKVDNFDMDRIIDRICDDRQAIVTYKGSSQYGDKLGNRISASTCGLAALNFARIAFKLEVDEGMQGMELLAELMSHKTSQVGNLILLGIISFILPAGDYLDLRLLEERLTP